MAIVMMVGAEHKDDPNVKTVTNYPGHAVTDWRHGFDCPHYRENPETQHADCLPERNAQGHRTGCHFMDPLYLRTSHVGLVLSIGERNGYDDSDFYAVVWNPATGQSEQIEYASTRGWTYPNGAAVDATPDVRAQYDAWVEARRVAAQAARAARDAKVPTVGKMVTVVKGRKVPIGTTGTVVWFGENKFARTNGATAWVLDTLAKVELGQYRVGIDTAAGRVFTDAKNVEVLADDASAS